MWVHDISSLVARSVSDDVTSIKTTAQSFQSWDTCMANKTCKIVAIVGIVLASLVLLWIVSTLIRCMCLGISCLEALCCCCCRPTRRPRYIEKEPPVSAYNNPNMYPPAAVPLYQTRAPQQAYFSGNQGYEPVSTNYEGSHHEKSTQGHNQGHFYDDENPFDDHVRYQHH